MIEIIGNTSTTTTDRRKTPGSLLVIYDTMEMNRKRRKR
jgi:hypothetical protein